MPPAEVTRILSAIEEGDHLAAKKLLPLVYDELRRLATRKMASEKGCGTGGLRIPGPFGCKPTPRRARLRFVAGIQIPIS